MPTERIIGIDFGTSTSLVKVKSYRDGKPVDGDPTSTQAVEFDNGRVTAPTLIRFAGEAVYFGQEAIPPKRDSELCSNFKLDLQSPDAAARAKAQELTRKYFRYLYEQYSGQSMGFGQFDTERTLVSYPAKWAKETREFMLQAARDAGFKNVGGMDEPTAALYTVMVQESKRLVQQGYLTAGKAAYVLMIDMGAGTTDLALCKYTPGGRNRIIDTWPPAESAVLFGGREMDELLLQYLTEYLKKCDMPDRMIANLEKNSLEDCKGWKENTVSSALARNAAAEDCAFVAPLLMMIGEAPPPFPAIDRAVLERYCKDYIGRYAELIAGAMAHARQADPDFSAGDLSLVVLTGGHSQWYFAKDMLCCSLPGYEGGVGVRLSADQVVTLRPPQHTVSSGLVFSAQFPAPKAEPEPVRPEESAVTHASKPIREPASPRGNISQVLCLWVTESHTMAAFQKNGRMCLIRTNSGEHNLPPLVTSDSQAQVREDTLSWIKETAERASGCAMRYAIFAVPAWFTMKRRAAIEQAAKRCGLSEIGGKRIRLCDLEAAVIGYFILNEGKEDSCLIYRREGDREETAIFELGDEVVESIYDVGRKRLAGGPGRLPLHALEETQLPQVQHVLLFSDNLNQEDQQDLMRSIEQVLDKRPELIQIQDELLMHGMFYQAERLLGEREDLLLLSSLQQPVSVLTVDGLEYLVDESWVYPAQGSETFVLKSGGEMSGIYFGDEKLYDLPFSLMLDPEETVPITDEDEARTAQAIADCKDAVRIEVKILVDGNMNIDAEVRFVEKDLRFELRPENMEKIRAAARQ